jgi:hypothetical protein
MDVTPPAPRRGGPVCLPAPEEARELNRLHDRSPLPQLRSPRQGRLGRLGSWAGWLVAGLALVTTVGRIAFHGPVWGGLGLVAFAAFPLWRWAARRRPRR